MNGPTSADLSGLVRLARHHGLDLRNVILRVQTDLFATAPRRDPAAVRAFSLIVSGLLPSADDATAEAIARKLAPIPETPEEVLLQLVGRGGAARRTVLEGVANLSEALEAAACADGTDLGPMLAARTGLSRRAVAELTDRQSDDIDLALAANGEADLRGAALEALVRRARRRPRLARKLFERADLGPVDLAPLFLHGDLEGRDRILGGIEGVAALRRVPGGSLRADRNACERLLDLAADRDVEAFEARLAASLNLAAPFARDYRDEAHQDLLGLSLLALGLTQEDAVRIFLTLADEIATSVRAVFRLAHRYRTTSRAAASYVVEAVLEPAAARLAGRYVPATADAEGVRDDAIRTIGPARHTGLPRATKASGKPG